jgi:hypothetical protein
MDSIGSLHVAMIGGEPPYLHVVLPEPVDASEARRMVGEELRGSAWEVTLQNGEDALINVRNVGYVRLIPST